MKEYIEREKLIAKLNNIAIDLLKDNSIQCSLAAGTVVDIKDNLVAKQPAADVVEVVRCKDCIYFQDRYIELPDGSKRPYKKDEYLVPISAGINVGSYCTKIDYTIVHGYRDCEPSIDKTRLWVSENDFCSYGERKDGE